ncbi:MAG: 2Fe-2S iron-sulfur cluster-binding protein [Syntrophothermus sp.]
MRVSVDGAAVEVAPGATVLEAARAASRWVPTLCFDERQAPFGACRVCLVGLAGSPGPVPACTTPCREGMEIETEDATARRVAGAVVELVLSELPEPPGPHTELAAVAARLGVEGSRWSGAVHEREEDLRHPYLALRHQLCISCGRCVRACDVGLDAGFEDSTCVACGACADTCPTGAIAELSLVAQSGEG